MWPVVTNATGIFEQINHHARISSITRAHRSDNVCARAGAEEKCGKIRKLSLLTAVHSDRGRDKKKQILQTR